MGDAVVVLGVFALALVDATPTAAELVGVVVVVITMGKCFGL